MSRKFTLPIKTRRAVLERFGTTCVYCGHIMDEASVTIDHLVPTSRGGTHEVGNLVTACRTCNTRKSKYGLNRLRRISGLRENLLPLYSEEQIEDLRNRFGIDVVPSYTFCFEIDGMYEVEE